VLLQNKNKLPNNSTAIKQTSTESHQTAAASANLPPKDFFASLTSRRNSTAAKPECTTAVEVDAYLADLSADLSSSLAYPDIRNVNRTLNAGLPASAAVERLFSLDGQIFTAGVSTTNTLR